MMSLGVMDSGGGHESKTLIVALPGTWGWYRGLIPSNPGNRYNIAVYTNEVDRRGR